MSNPYNGWTNFETWLVSLHIDNDQYEQQRWAERAEELLKGRDHTDNDVLGNVAYDLSKEIKDAHEEGYTEAMEKLSGVHNDMIRAAYSEVNWLEVARSIVDSAVESIA